ncbi:uncharacterized protein LOC133312812 [Gastrolobium bilobum]|uniref:uncharacterized protein LOC133312812 n=1 Tax=Gastrolobium bilobum TaxID=150636 RepID=UPI002AAF2989|nr:uncharacterized protein LOC133312812 [Gastrolobium bilobum]
MATMHNFCTYNVEEIVFEVYAGWEISYFVNPLERSCQCGKFKALKYPCSHAATMTLHIRRNPHQYVDDVFKTTNLVNAYSFLWQPIGNEQAISPSIGPVVITDKNMLHAKVRPKSTKIRNKMDEVETSQAHYKYGLCKQPGHNRMSCPVCGSNS